VEPCEKNPRTEPTNRVKCRAGGEPNVHVGRT